MREGVLQLIERRIFVISHQEDDTFLRELSEWGGDPEKVLQVLHTRRQKSKNAENDRTFGNRSRHWSVAIVFDLT